MHGLCVFPVACNSTGVAEVRCFLECSGVLRYHRNMFVQGTFQPPPPDYNIFQAFFLVRVWLDKQFDKLFDKQLCKQLFDISLQMIFVVIDCFLD
jgi:hypothetical protein